MTVDLRTEINDCNAVTGWAGDGGPSLNTLTGQRYEGSGSIDGQHANADEETFTSEDSLNTGTFSLDWSDSTLYMLAKDNLVDTAANGGIQFIIGDGGAIPVNRIGYDVGGNDAVGMPLSPFFNAFKLDVSNRPASFTVQLGVEANLVITAITHIGYGSLHLAKAQGNVANIFLDYFSFITNGNYALRINGGTLATPETMADVQVDDVTNGTGLIANPLGNQFLFFGPTEWGEPVANVAHHFKADNEQWFWIGDNGGGHAVGATHFPFRVVANATDAGSFVLNNVVIVNTGTRAELLWDDANIDTLEVDGCSLFGLGTVGLPSAGGTSRFTTNTVFNDCDQITHNGASMNGSSVGGYEGAANTSALIYNETADPNGEMDDMSFTMGTALTHAIEFGTASPLSMTLTDVTFTGYSASNNVNNSAIHVKRTSGTVTININGGTTPSFRTDGATVVISADVTVTFTGMFDDTEVRIYDQGTGAEIAGIENATDGTTDNRSFAWSDANGNVVNYVIHNVARGQTVRVEGFTVPSSNTSIPIQQSVERNYKNP